MKKKITLVQPFDWDKYTVTDIKMVPKCPEQNIMEADFETAIAATGFGKFNLVLLLITIPSCWTSVLATTTMSYVIPTARCDLDLTLQKGGILNAITYVGMISSAFLWGFLADTLGRKKLLVAGYLLDGCFVLLAGVSQNFVMLLIAKYMSGFIINGPYAVLTTDIAEFHCAKYRARVLLIMGIFYTSANLVLPLIAWPVLTTNLDVDLFEGQIKLHSWNFFILICAIPSLVSCLAHTFLPESPKFLMTVGRNKEAINVLRKVYTCNTGNHPDTYPIKSLVEETKLQVTGKHGGFVTANRTKTQALKEGWQQIRPLFFPPHLAKLVLVCTIQLGVMSGSNTLRLWLPHIFTAINDYKKVHPNDGASLCRMLEIIPPISNQTVEECVVNTISGSVYTNSTIVAAVGFLGYVCVGMIINILGKKPVLIIFGLVSGTCGMSIYFAKNELMTIFLSSVMVALSAVNSNVMMTVIVDLFPTTLRTMTVAAALMVGRTGTMTGNLIFPFLLQTGCMPPFFVLGLLIIGCALLSIALPKTDLKPLK